MEPKKRRELEASNMKELILDAAGRLIAEKGTDQLSIRKIATQIGYTPGIMYHYFKNKEDIITQCMERGYRSIVESVSLPLAESIDPIQELKIMTRQYIQNALKMPDEFVKMHLNQSAQIQQYTAFLQQGAAADKPALKRLYHCLSRLHQITDAVIHPELELRAQLIAAATFGLISKLSAEQTVSAEQKEALISYFSNVAVIQIAAGRLSE